MTNTILLREVFEEDLPIFFEHQRDSEANQMAAFAARDRETFMAHWAGILRDETNLIRTILFDGQVAGNIVSFVQADQREVGYWIGKDYWGKGIATHALTQFLGLVLERPLYAHVAKHNAGSLRVLEKCGFIITGEDSWPQGDTGEVVEEFILVLQAEKT